MSGHQFTRERGGGMEGWIEERLDKVLATTGWSDMNGGAWIENILTRTSDHSTLFLNINATTLHRGRGSRGFRFKMAWLHDEGCRDVVETVWQDGMTEGLLNYQQHCGSRLMRWGGEHFHKFGDRMKQLQKKQEVLRDRRDQVALAEFQRLEGLLCQLEA
ncbi:PREDICTED: uncharacterized protein LOC109150388 [Ipomoea nil]|uniref:uncharacterized protein LOC109150388 n=1 Tax=Ipomoea nil TaxID=35883 RepID=UPI000901F943|nr:PREDICTED: uncharacterized protein LOC109150388 [Ipomoea nil]